LLQCTFHIKKEGGRKLCEAVFPFLGAAIPRQHMFPHPDFQGYYKITTLFSNPQFIWFPGHKYGTHPAYQFSCNSDNCLVLIHSPGQFIELYHQGRV
jgi:hypothetical protein